MIVRLFVGVALTAALLSISAPALSTAQADAADATAERQLSALAERLRTMVATDSPTRESDARRIVTVRLPERSLTSAGVTELRFHTRQGVGVASWRVRDAMHTKRLVSVPIRPVGGSLTLREPGPHRLSFALERQDGRTVVTVRRMSDTESSAGGRADA
ncbi:DUF7311 family protein [Haloarcula amylovorans]|uniref:DUF7311 family protein n=1 Tax=Haloarcula amylovorans TaxID=2562280 RepID=UPI001075FE1E|nr:hypothetical protein [Halomicroarcula amylolytica]